MSLEMRAVLVEYAGSKYVYSRYSPLSMPTTYVDGAVRDVTRSVDTFKKGRSSAYSIFGTQ